MVLHASPYRKGASSGIEAEEASLVEQLAGWKQDHPDVSVQAMVVSVTRTPTSSSGPASLLCWCLVDGSGMDGVTGLTPFSAPWSNRRTAH